jgi:hypothetical protein
MTVRWRIGCGIAVCVTVMVALCVGYLAHAIVGKVRAYCAGVPNFTPAGDQLAKDWETIEKLWDAGRDAGVVAAALAQNPGVTNVRIVDAATGLFELEVDGRKMLVGCKEGFVAGEDPGTGWRVAGCSVLVDPNHVEPEARADRYLVFTASGGLRMRIRSPVPPIPGCAITRDQNGDGGYLVHDASDLRRLGAYYPQFVLDADGGTLRVRTLPSYTPDDPGR